MIRIDSSDILKQTEKTEALYKKGATAPLFFDDFMAKTTSKITKVEDFVPYEVKIPKAFGHLKQKDYEPSRILQIKQPILDHNGIPMWTESAMEGIRLEGFGYKNGDSRYPSEITLCDKSIHAFLVGVTGHGKSVTLNGVAQNILKRYAPWEARFLMADAKVAEFKRYATGSIAPHIKSIAATRDSDYILSVLESGYKEMLDFNGIMANAGVKHYTKFRELTGLAVPRTIVVIDEWQTMVKEAGKKAKRFFELVDLYGRLGRNAAYHLILCSQEAGDTPKETMNNIQIRASLGADASTSTKILGNDEAKINYGKMGRIIVNTNAVNNDKADNQHFRVPFQTDEMFENDLKSLEEAGKLVGFKQPLSFYDGDSYLNEDAYKEALESKNITASKLLLGEPSFVMDDPENDGFLPIKFDGADIENIVIHASSPTGVERLSKMLMYNMQNSKTPVVNEVYTAEKSLSSRIGFDGWTTVDCREFQNDRLQSAILATYTRKLYLDADDLAFSGTVNPTEDSDQVIDAAFPDGSEFKTELNRIRTMCLLQQLSSPYYSVFGVTNMVKENGKLVEDQNFFKVVGMIQNAFKYFKAMQSMNTKLNVSNLKPVFYWIIGLDKMLGIGRNGNSKDKNAFKKILLDSYLANVRFICTLTDATEFSEFKVGFRFHLMDGLTETQARRLGADYPDTVGAVLSVFYDSNSETKEALKFKKMAFNGELIST